RDRERIREGASPSERLEPPRALTSDETKRMRKHLSRIISRTGSQIQKELDVSRRTGDRRLTYALHRAPERKGAIGTFVDGGAARHDVAHPPALPHFAAAHLELRLHQPHDRFAPRAHRLDQLGQD